MYQERIFYPRRHTPEGMESICLTCLSTIGPATDDMLILEKLEEEHRCPKPYGARPMVSRGSEIPRPMRQTY